MSDDLRRAVREKYAAFITRQTGCGTAGCCSADAAGRVTQAVTGGLYSADETAGLPRDAVAASLGCGNPTALAELHDGETVLDLGSGAGLDVLLSARRVGSHGKAYGLDMTEEMLAAARANQARAGVDNVEFLQGYIEDIPLPDNAVDVVISNCVINLSGDKDRVLREAFRVLRPGGRLAVSDIIVVRPLPRHVQDSLAAWAGCIAGALTEAQYRAKLEAAGFTGIAVEVTRVYDFSPQDIAAWCPDLSAAEQAALQGAVVSAFIRAKKPAQILTPGRDYLLQLAAADDFTAIATLLTAAGLPVSGVTADQGDFFVARQHGRVVGVIGVMRHGDAALLRSLAVQNDRRKAGIGGALLAWALEQAQAGGARAAYLLTTTAEGFFRRHGFTDVPRQAIPASLLADSTLADICPVASVCMRRVLSAADTKGF